MQTQSATAGPRIVTDPYFTSSPFEPELPPVERLEDIDVTDPDLYIRGDPHATWKLLRDEAPIFWHEKSAAGTEGRGFWILARYAEFNSVLRDPNFSNCESPLLDTTGAQFGGEAGLSTSDRPQHPQMRRMISKHVSAGVVARYEDHLRSVITQLLDEASATGECDFAKAVSLRLPPPALAAFFEMDTEESQGVERTAAALHNTRSPEQLAQFSEPGLILFDQMIRDRRASPRDDLVSTILAAEMDGAPLTHEQVLFFVWALFLGGLDSTVHAASAMLLSLFHHPQEFQRLRDEPGLMGPGAIEELLRWTSVSQHLKRKVIADTELLGQPVRAGDYVCVFQASANRDERFFHDPFRLDLGRSPHGIATFGSGAHTCPGLHLARLELKILFEELLRRFSKIEQTGPVERNRCFSILLPPITSLKVSLTPA